MKYSIFLLLVMTFTSCISTKSTIQNIDNSAVKPIVKNSMFLFTEYAEDGKYGFDADYPINIGLILERQEQQYLGYFFNGLEGKNGEKISFKKVDTCCPFPTKNNTMGAGTLSIYEYQFEGTNKKGVLYFNILEKGKILCPKGFKIKTN
ncbi:2-dehydro-3-deoxyphosphooctonate aldolase [Flavobacterium sp. N2270]|uniref:2-dehydro-3-deoxyphosphooctonate aldolase n=1 Tax=Flavobacterium sp. N2270 TaxID=2986831 RepID=UPI0022247CC4|nr:2-dehydro-3-deoxyphosphooctonate aldolase [Flavobacterium sp. N2270]